MVCVNRFRSWVIVPMIVAAALAFPLPSNSAENALEHSSSFAFEPSDLIYTVTALSLDHGEYSYTYKRNRNPGRCSVIQAGKNKGKLRCCAVIKSGNNKGKRRCTVSNAPRNPVEASPIADPARPASPNTPQRPEPRYDVDPSILEFEGPLLGAASEYSFLSLGPNGVPARWNKCNTVRYRVNPDGLPETALEDIREAIRRLSLASQITFEYTGATNVIPYRNQAWYEDIPAAERQSTELWIAFSNETSVPSLAGSPVGLGGPIWQARRNSDAQIIAGGIVLDTDPGLEPGFGFGPKRGSLILHELGHVMNLGHVADPVQLMFPTLLDETRSMFQNGDLAAFRHLHSYPCF